MIEFPKYVNIKNNYCVCYFGPVDEYLLQLSLLKPIIENQFKGINFFIGCRDDKIAKLNCPSILRLSELKMKRYDFGHIREIRYNGQTHPIVDFINESDIKNIVVCNELEKEHTTKCVIVTKANYPTVSLDSKKAEVLIRIATSEGYCPEIDGDIKGAGLVMGVESYDLFSAASKGIKTRLIKTGIGHDLFKSMFPKCDLLNLK
jgi:hypothetical protein